MTKQNCFVAILDRFDTLTNDLTSGIPAEMEKRGQPAGEEEIRHREDPKFL